MNDFLESIKKNLEMNGFPQKKVSLPLEKMYEIADEKNINFNKVLEELEKESIKNTKTSDKIIFYKEVEMPDLSSLGEMLKNKDPKELMKMAQEYMANLSPEQQEQMKNQFMNMDPKEREDLMKKANDLGLNP